MDPIFFPIPLWDLKIWNNSSIYSFVLRIHLFLQNLNIFCRSTKNQKIEFFFLFFFVFLWSQLLNPPPFYLRFSENSALRFRKKPEIGTTIHAQPLIQKFLKFHSVI
jgi:hypothetical protein